MDAADTTYGDPAQASWPADAVIQLKKTSGRKLTDLLSNTRNALIASPRLRAIIEQHCKKQSIEYLPFSLLDHRGRLLSKDYVIVNPLGGFDCLDTKASEIEWDDEEPGEVIAIEKVVLSARKVRHAPPLFRVKEDGTMYMLNSTLAIDIYNAKLTNVFWDEFEPK